MAEWPTVPRFSQSVNEVLDAQFSPLPKRAFIQSIAIGLESPMARAERKSVGVVACEVAGRLLRVGAALFLVAAASPASATEIEISEQVGSQLNISTDSPVGWTPTNELRQEAITTLRTFLDSVEAGQYARAYTLLSAETKSLISPAQFEAAERALVERAGQLRSWKVQKVTWYKNPQAAPWPGTYVAFDLTGDFAKADRACGYVVISERDGRDGFEVVRQVHNYLDNATALSIEKQGGVAAVSEIWAKLSNSCPGYVQ